MPQDSTRPTTLGDLRDLVRRLRGPGGCPWDQAQTLPDLKQYLLEECYEVMDAIEAPRLDKLREELGDLLFQIVFLACLAEEAQAFDLNDVLRDIHEKMVRRHPHVFARERADDPDAVRANWWKIKRSEGASSSSMLDSVPRHLPSLQRAYRLGKRASRAGLDWPGPGPVLEKVREETGELEAALAHPAGGSIVEELGDLLFSLANLARHLQHNPEEALQRSNNKFIERFRRMEKRALETGVKLEALDADERDRWWEEEKRRDPRGHSTT